MKIYILIYILGALSATCTLLVIWAIGYINTGNKNKKPMLKKTAPRFQLPSTEEIIGIAILFNGGKIEPEKLADMVAMCSLVIDRLYENGDIRKPSIKENQ